MSRSCSLGVHLTRRRQRQQRSNYSSHKSPLRIIDQSTDNVNLSPSSRIGFSRFITSQWIGNTALWLAFRVNNQHTRRHFFFWENESLVESGCGENFDSRRETRRAVHSPGRVQFLGNCALDCLFIRLRGCRKQPHDVKETHFVIYPAWGIKLIMHFIIANSSENSSYDVIV